MIVHLYDYNKRRPEPVEIPDQPIHDFVRYIMETDKWRDLPAEVMYERVRKLRRRLMDEKQPAPEAPAEAE